MNPVIEQLSSYAAYHRDRRNIVTHLIGIPMIVFAIVVLLARPAVPLAGTGWALSPALAITIAAGVYYLTLDLRLGILLTGVLALMLLGANQIAQWETTAWLSLGIGLFVVGWIFQFVGHYFEGRKPAFVDDLRGLLIGPLFVLAEFMFLLGFGRDLERAIERRVGPVRNGQQAQSA